MNADGKNQYGLRRDIPPSVKAEVRRRSKYGCVVCRAGIYQYEHIDPEFKDARKHEAENICCLCGRCHDKVTRRLLSKSAIKSHYLEVQESSSIEPPKEFFDFHTGEAKLLFGGLICDPTPKSVFRCNGVNLFSVAPGVKGVPGEVYATFNDDKGVNLFKISGNEWVGPTTSHDLEVVGQRFKLKTIEGNIVLQLRHDAPGKIVLERLDMRLGCVHILATEYDFAVGRYTGHGDNLVWIHAKTRIDTLFSQPVAIEVGPQRFLPGQSCSRVSINDCGIIFNQSGELKHVLSSDSRLLKHNDPVQCGIHWPGMGFQIAKGCGFAFSAVAIGVCSIRHARQNFYRKNRMNVPQLYLPAIINASTIKAEQERLEKVRSDNLEEYLREPFLVLADEEALSDFNRRQSQVGSQKMLEDNHFNDDKPGCYGAWGIIKLKDDYEGPAIRVQRAHSN